MCGRGLESGGPGVLNCFISITEDPGTPSNSLGTDLTSSPLTLKVLITVSIVGLTLRVEVKWWRKHEMVGTGLSEARISLSPVQPSPLPQICAETMKERMMNRI